MVSPAPPAGTRPPPLQVALSLAFNGKGSQVWLSVLDLLGNIVYFLDLLLGFHIGFLARWDGRVAVVTGARALGRCRLGQPASLPSQGGGRDGLGPVRAASRAAHRHACSLDGRALLPRPAAADGREVALRYIKQGSFLVDLLACVPSVVQLVLLAVGWSHDAWRALWLLRMLRLARVFHLLASLQR